MILISPCLSIAEDLKSQLSFLNQCSTNGIAVGNVIRWFKKSYTHDEEIIRLSSLELGLHDDKIREKLIDKINEYIHGRIVTSINQIQKVAVSKILNKIKCDDFVLIYKSDSLVLNSLCIYLKDNPKNRFRIFVVDDFSDPEACFSYRRLKEIEETDESLTMKVYYSPISSITHLFKNSNIKNILIGCEGILQNGNVLAHAGTAVIATIAKQFNVPVVVFCESYKFHEDIQTDSIKKNAIVSWSFPSTVTSSENGTGKNAKNAQTTSTSQKDNDSKAIRLHKVVYDVTDSSLLSAIVTDVHSGLLPMSSIPIILNDEDKPAL